MKAVFMYHAVGKGEEIAGADPHYAVSSESFREHLSIIESFRTLADCVATGRLDNHIVTFDDGHISNYSIAYPALLEAGQVAEFYINTAVVGKPGFITWSHAQEMLDSGMSIQSHAHTHRYMSDLPEKEIREELGTSRNLIEDKLGSQVSVFAPPGGRFDRRVEAIAAELGYITLAVSRPGHMKSATQKIVPRYAVLHGTGSDQVRELLRPDSRVSRQQLAKYHITGLGKRVLGNRLYDSLRERLLGGT